MNARYALALALILAGCSKTEKKPDIAPVTSVAPAVTSAAPSASASGGHRKHEDRHDKADENVPPFKLDVKIGGAMKSWTKESLDKVPRQAGAKGNDGEDRETWSLRDVAHTLVGPKARVVSIAGPEESKTIDKASWDDASKTPIIHTTRRGTLKFRWADKAGKWGDADVKDVSRLEIEP